MADKLHCPICDATSSSVLSGVRNRGECPYCHAPASLILQVNALRDSNANQGLVDQIAEMGKKLADVERERDRYKRAFEAMHRVSLEIEED